MNVQSTTVTRHRIALYRKTMRDSDFDEERIQRNLKQCWVWRNVFVAETDAEAERVAIPAFQAMQEQRARLRERIYAEQGVRLKAESRDAPPARLDPRHALICGSPATVAAAFGEIERIGAGGVIAQFRLGPMPHETAAESLRLFMSAVAPEFRSRAS